MVLRLVIEKERKRKREGAQAEEIDVIGKSSKNQGQSKGHGRGRQRCELHVIVDVVIELLGELKKRWPRLKKAATAGKGCGKYP